MNEKKTSVLISIYHKENAEYFDLALKSIANQTLQADEIIIVEDGELTPELQKVISHHKKTLPIKHVGYKENRGLTYALNYGLNYCSNDIIIRADTDDICLSDRFEKQYDYLDKNKNIDVISSWIEERYNMEVKGVIKKVPESNSEIVKYAKLRNPINHPASAFRKNVVMEAGGYPNIFPEDYALWSLLITKRKKFGNINEVLVIMRTDANFIKRRGVNFLFGEIKLIFFQKKIGLINNFELVRNLFLRTLLRSSPKNIKKLLYQKLR